MFAVYSTFLQRAYDQIIHDAAIENQHIVLAVDRAGIVGDDGETHQGIFDVAFLSTIPNATIYSPSDYAELRQCLHKAAYDTPGVAVVRYPRGKESGAYPPLSQEYQPYHLLKGTGECLIVTYGRLFDQAVKAKEFLQRQGIDPPVLKLTRISPLPEEAVRLAAQYSTILFFEEGIRSGGAGEHFETALLRQEFRGKILLRAIESQFVPQAPVERALEQLGLSAQAMAQLIIQETT